MIKKLIPNGNNTRLDDEDRNLFNIGILISAISFIILYFLKANALESALILLIIYLISLYFKNNKEYDYFYFILIIYGLDTFFYNLYILFIYHLNPFNFLVLLFYIVCNVGIAIMCISCVKYMLNRKIDK